MNPFVADPAWGWWIILYFYLGGISAGLYFIATLIELWGQEPDRLLARIGYRVAFPLICLCGIFLIVDLDRPERFWHMMFQSEAFPLPMLKWWSPMSIGAWAIGLFGLWTFISFLMTFRKAQGQPSLGFGGALVRLIGSGLGFFIASYTGVLLTSTNQPLWSISQWIAPLFLTSATSTAISVMILLGGNITPETRERLEKANLWALGLELFLFLIFLASLGGLLPIALQTWQGLVLVLGTLSVGLLIPLGLHMAPVGFDSVRVTLASLFALAGGFLLRFGIITVAPALLIAIPKPPPESLNAALIESAYGKALIVGTVLLAVTIPIFLSRRWQLGAARTALAGVVSLLVVGAVLYYSMQPISDQEMVRVASQLHLSPEDHRPEGNVGASLFNRPDPIETPHSKFLKGGAP